MNAFANDRWEPKYPQANDCLIELRGEELSTYVNDRKVGVYIQDEPLEEPACFFIDRERIFFRINWKLWVKVSSSNSDEVELLINSPVCQIYYTVKNNSKYLTAPVYHIKALPKELFTNAFERNELIDKIMAIIKNLPIKLDMFENICFGGDIIPFALSKNDHALLLDIMLSDDVGSEDKIIERLKRVREELVKKDIGNAKVDIRVLCDEMTMESIKMSKEDKIDDDILIPTNHLEDKIVSLLGANNA